METIKKKITFKKLLEINATIFNKNLDSSKRDRLSASIVQLSGYLKNPMEQYNKKQMEIYQELCSVDSEGNFYLDDKLQPIYTKINKANQKKLDERIDKLLKEEVEIEVKYCTDLTRIKTLHLSFIDILNGYVFDLSEEQIEEIFIASDIPQKEGVSQN